MIDGRRRLVAAGRGRLAAGRCQADQVISNAAVLLFGGIETTEGMIANAALYLLAAPGRARRPRRNRRR